MNMDNDQLSDCWDCISKSLARIMKRFEKLPEREQDSEFTECVERALCHAERRAEALIDPS